MHKLNANDYTTALSGLKFKIAHKRADSEKWSATPTTQRKRMIKFLQDMIRELEQQQDGETEAETAIRKPAANAARKAARKTTRRRGQPAAPRSMRKPSRRRPKRAA